MSCQNPEAAIFPILKAISQLKKKDIISVQSPQVMAELMQFCLCTPTHIKNFNELLGCIRTFRFFFW